MKSVVFVCLGNICRSPMAEAIFNHLVDEAGLSNAITVSSRATSTEEEGNPPHPGAQETMRRHGLDFTGFRSQPISKQDFETADYIITMDQQNVANLKRMAPAGTEQKKSTCVSISYRVTKVKKFQTLGTRTNSNTLMTYSCRHCIVAEQD